MTKTEAENFLVINYRGLISHAEATLVKLGFDNDQAGDFVNNVVLDILQEPGRVQSGLNPLSWVKMRIGWGIRDYAKRERKFRRVGPETLDREQIVYPDPDLEIQAREAMEAES